MTSSRKILGLDLGTNSIGWAIVDEGKEEILGMGSRIFPMGVENLGDGDGEISKNASRTGARGVRRQFFRKRLRKKVLLKALSENNMCPLTSEDFQEWKNKKVFPEEKLKMWFAMNPYELRDKALTEKLDLHEVGRVFYHLIQRRGFLSNSRKGGADDGAIFKGNPKEGKIGIDETNEKINDKTLGSYLNEIYPKDKAPFKSGLERIRNRYTTRKMYVDEFEQIWQNQEKYYQSFTKEMKQLFGGRKVEEDFSEDGILFHQRPLKSQKHLVGNCSFENNKIKCPISAIPFEEFRAWQWVNTVECNGKKITQGEKEKIVESLYSLPSSKDKVEFKAIRKVIGRIGAEYKFNYKDDDKVVGAYTISSLSNKKFFSNEWASFSEKEKEDIWHVLYFFDSKSNLKEYAIEKWGFDEVKAEAISKFNLKDGYSSISRKAINNILPFLKLGFTYDMAVVFGGVKNAFGEKWSKLTDLEMEFLMTNIPSIVRSKMKGGFIEPLKEILMNEYGLTEKELKKLYHHSESLKKEDILNKLPIGKEADKEIQDLRNPIVVTALFELRKLINELIDEHGSFYEIKVEMARDLKASKSQRNAIRSEQKRLERENDRVKGEVEKYTRVSHDNMLKFKLWEECKQTCPYTGVQIPLNKLFTGEIQIEHIHPWSRSLNDSYNNKTLCWADENRKKGDKTPYEFYSGDEANWEVIKHRALKLFSDTKEYPKAYQKFKRFVQQKFDDDFSSRQLNDTRYISKEAKDYLSKICRKVTVSPGQMTAVLRQKWGLNSLINEENIKTREDHRHHAIDALVLTCSKQSYLQELSKWNRYNRNSELNDFPIPWEMFRKQAETNVNSILVSHKRSKNVITVRSHKVEKNGETYRNLGVAARGQLHKETVFGKRKAPFAEEAFHVRKAIDSLTTEKQVLKVVDTKIRELIYKRIEQLGGFQKDKIPNNTFFIVDENGIKQPQIFLPNKNGAPVPVLKVRMKENFSGAEKLKDKINQWVNPRNNHHVLIYKDSDGNLKEDVVTFWTAVERKRNGDSVYKLPFDGAEIITSLHINDMFVLGYDNNKINLDEINSEQLKKSLFKIQTLSSGVYEFRLSTDSTQIKDTNSDVFRRIQSFGNGKTGWLTFNPIKVKISSSGKLAFAN
jgi:CRISPR-associated endonuclease Csn1